ncbi:MAG: EI24 domain-containing protein [Bdellovibrionales bacterium]|nr:EI24 domain-containing protein [Bdellovibrionales bacterium]
MLKRLTFGFQSFFVGFRMVRKHPSLLKYILIPIFISILFMSFGLYFSFEILPAWVKEFFPQTESIFKQTLYWISMVFAAVSTFLLVILNSFVLANILNIPMNTKLCEKLLKKEFNWEAKSRNFKEFVKTFIYFLLIGIVKTLIILVIGFFAFALSFVPFLSLFAAALGMLVLAFDCSDITFEIKEWGLKRRWQFFTQYKPEFLGFSFGIGLFSLIPGLNFVLLPFIVLGASHMVQTLDMRNSNGTMSIS